MIRTIRIILDDNPSDGDKFSFNLEVPSELGSFSPEFTFMTSPVDFFDIGILANVGLTSVALYEKLLDYFIFYTYVTIVQNADGASIVVDAEDSDSSTISITGDITITHTVASSPAANVILSRSPYFVKITPSFTFDSAIVEIRIWSGHKTTDKPVSANYVFSKSVLQAGQLSIAFDIHSVINDFVKSEYSSTGTTGAFTSSLLESRWIETKITAYMDGVSVATSFNTYLCTDGFGYHLEGANPECSQYVLCDISEHIIYNACDYPLYFRTANLTSISINSISIPFTFNQDYNNQNIAYINLGAYVEENTSLSVVFVYESGTVTHTVKCKNECKFDVVRCIFKNRYGLWQAFHFSKLSKEAIGVTKKQYNAVTISGGNYSIYKHGKRTFNVQGKKKISVNTDFITEEYNIALTELHLSEFVYLDSLPVDLLTDTFNIKTKLNNKLIQYPLEFEYSYNLINDVN